MLGTHGCGPAPDFDRLPRRTVMYCVLRRSTYHPGLDAARGAASPGAGTPYG